MVVVKRELSTPPASQCKVDTRASQTQRVGWGQLKEREDDSHVVAGVAPSDGLGSLGRQEGVGEVHQHCHHLDHIKLALFNSQLYLSIYTLYPGVPLKNKVFH